MFGGKKFLGVDVGTSAVKLVELSQKRGRVKVENYGRIETKAFYEQPFRTFKRGTFLLSVEDISRAISAIKREAGIKTEKVNFSIPDFSTFFTSIELPPMSKEELPEAVEFEARQHVPLPMSELTLDWSLIEGKFNQTRLKLLVVAIPDRVVDQYKEVAQRSNLSARALEAEVFSMKRALPDSTNDKLVIMIDIGAQTTTVSVVEEGTLKTSHNFDISGNDFTQNLTKSLQVEYEQAEFFKKKYGLKPEGETVREILLNRLNLIIAEVKKISRRYQEGEGEEIEQVILSGGSSLMPGLEPYFKQELNSEINIIRPFSNLYYPSILEERLKQMGPSFAVAVGLALRGVQK